MTGVNDLAGMFDTKAHDYCRDWRKEGTPESQGQSDAFDFCAEAIRKKARTAWHPVSEPPTEGGDADLVLTWRQGWDRCVLVRLGDIRLMAEQGDGHGLCWARQKDVVLTPPAGESTKQMGSG